MSIFPADSAIFGPLFVPEPFRELFSDEALLRRMLNFEAALARVQGRLGIIPQEAAESAGRELRALDPTRFDLGELGRATRRDGVPVPGFVRQLRSFLSPESRDWVHYGATSQDVLDTAFVQQYGSALELFEERLADVIAALARLVRSHQHTVMLGRTHGRHALPVTFALKAGTWLAPFLRHRERLSALKPRLLAVQLGGAAGTLSVLGASATAARRELASELGLSAPPLPWHTQRDSLFELAAVCSGIAASAGKLAQDVLLLSTEEIGELDDSGARGGSSTLPHKQNPIRCELIITSARACAGLLANLQQAQLQEHERATHGWQLEWTALPQLVSAAGGALTGAAGLARDLHVDKEAMRRNLDAARGLVLAERVTFALAARLGRDAATEITGHAAGLVRSGEAPDLISAVRGLTDEHLDWTELADPLTAVGASAGFTGELLTLAGDDMKRNGF